MLPLRRLSLPAQATAGKGCTSRTHTISRTQGDSIRDSSQTILRLQVRYTTHDAFGALIDCYSVFKRGPLDVQSAGAASQNALPLCHWTVALHVALCKGPVM